MDADSENDSIPDRNELRGDSDGDGIEDRLDRDDDGDRIRSAFEGFGDTDGDGLGDHIDTDSDDDGRLDAEEGLRDEDCDGMRNYVDFDDQDGPCGPVSWLELDTGDTGVDEPDSEKAGSCSALGGRSLLGSVGVLWMGAIVLSRRQRRER